MYDEPHILSKAREFIRSNRASAARPLVDALDQLGFDPLVVAELDATLLSKSGRRAEAKLRIDEALRSAPADLALLLLRAELSLDMGDANCAAASAAAGVVASPANARANALLGLALLRLGHAADALVCLTKARSLDPAKPAFHQTIAEIHMAMGGFAEAQATLAAAVARFPEAHSLRAAATETSLRCGNYPGVVELASAACAAGIAGASVFSALGRAHTRLGRNGQAAEAFAEALKLAPCDASIQHLCASVGLRTAPDRAPPAFVETTFDTLADRYDQEAIATGYRLPELFRTHLRDFADRGRPVQNLLDLGCGTGLLAAATGPFDQGITGIDLSARMLGRAAKTGAYAELWHEDAAGFVLRDERQWDVIVMSDVLPYFGDIAAILQGAARRLSPGGSLVVALDELVSNAEPDRMAPRSWHLERDGRYRHAGFYLSMAAAHAGLQIGSSERLDLRMGRDRTGDSRVAILTRIAS